MSTPDTLADLLEASLQWLTDYAIDLDGCDEEIIAQIRGELECAIRLLRDGHRVIGTALSACNEQPRFSIAADDTDSTKLARRCEAWLALYRAGDS